MPWLKTRDIRDGVVTADKLASTLDLGADTFKIDKISESTAGNGVRVDDLKIKDGGLSTSATGTALLSGLSAAGVNALVVGDAAASGLALVVQEVTTVLTNAVALDTTIVLPTPAWVLSVQARLDDLIVGDASGDDLLARVGIGVSGGDEDAFGDTTDLTKNQKVTTLLNTSQAGVTIAIFGLKADGATACTEKFVAGTSVTTRVVYWTLAALANA